MLSDVQVPEHGLGEGGSGDSGDGGGTPSSTAPRARRSRWLEASALPILLVALVGVFSGTSPRTFLTVGNAASVFGTNTVLLGVTAAVLIALYVGEFDLSLGAIAGLSSMVTAVLNVEGHVPILLACLAGVGAALAVGAVNAALIVLFDNNSFIITLASGTAVTGVVYWISGSATISGTAVGFSNWVFGNTFLGIPLEFYYGLGLVLIGWYVFELTPLGQRMNFVGQSRSVAGLSGVRVNRIRIGAFITAALIAGLAGLVNVATAGSANPASGPEFLLPAFAAAFLGSTAIRPGRVNMEGAFIAVYFLAIGTDGLELLGVQNWVHTVFYGGALIIAVTTGQILKRRLR